MALERQDKAGLGWMVGVLTPDNSTVQLKGAPDLRFGDWGSRCLVSRMAIHVENSALVDLVLGVLWARHRSQSDEGVQYSHRELPDSCSVRGDVTAERCNNSEMK
jgi:hypothetical protein